MEGLLGARIWVDNLLQGHMGSGISLVRWMQLKQAVKSTLCSADCCPGYSQVSRSRALVLLQPGEVSTRLNKFRPSAG